jgi:competence protein ComFC
MQDALRTKTLHIVKKIAEYTIDTIAPPDPTVRHIEYMTIKEFLSKVQRAEVVMDPLAPRAILSYKDTLVKTAILEVKSYGNKRLALLLGSVLYRHLCAEFAYPTLIIPIPITKKSLRARGWNQCELVCRGLEKVDTEKRFEIRTDILYKIRETADQVGKGRQARFENLRDCFAVQSPEKVVGKRVIIFDDILTTGATLGEAASAIVRAGASHVTCIALAH